MRVNNREQDTEMMYYAHFKLLKSKEKWALNY